jgi:hypothetical protein
MAGRRGGVFAHSGTMPSILLLPEQLASSTPKIDMTAMRIMPAVSPMVPSYPLLKPRAAS